MSISRTNGGYEKLLQEYLDFLEKHVSAKLRERNIDEISNKAIASRLPKWRTSKKIETQF